MSETLTIDERHIVRVDEIASVSFIPFAVQSTVSAIRVITRTGHEFWETLSPIGPSQDAPTFVRYQEILRKIGWPA